MLGCNPCITAQASTEPRTLIRGNPSACTGGFCGLRTAARLCGRSRAAGPGRAGLVSREKAMERIWECLNGFTQFSTVLISSIALLFHIRWSRRATALGPTILTTLGIFFCFAGIAWGLLDFEPNNVRSSVPHLLGGIRTAFWSSVVGIFWALTLKTRVALFGDANVAASGAQEGSTVDDLARLLLQLNRSLAGGDDCSLLSQAKLLRADSNDRIDRLAEAFNRYAENIAETNSKALVSALSEVVRDFNVKIHEQFGDNFRQLNSGVERLVSWQVQYENQLEALIEQRIGQLISRSEQGVRPNQETLGPVSRHPAESIQAMRA